MASEDFSSSIAKDIPTQLIGRQVLYYPRTTSTNEAAKRLARRGAAEGTVVVADEQTRGRGRQGRSWVASPRSSILASIVLHPAVAQLPQLGMAASLAIMQAIKVITGLESSIKWPNDVLLNGKKVSGILVEGEVTGDRVDFAIVGIGINVNLDVSTLPEIAAIATSLSQETARVVSRLAVWRSLLQEFEELYLSLRWGQSLREEWQAHLETLGRWVQVMGKATLEEGLAEDVDEQGRLLLRKADGTLLVLSEGDVSVV